MGKSKIEEQDINGLERKLLEKKRLLTNGTNSSHDNGINLKKLTRDEKEKIRKALKKKKRKLKKKESELKEEESSDEEEETIKREAVPKPEFDPNIEVEYVEKDEYLLTGKYYDEFKHVFQYFAPKQNVNEMQDEEEDEDAQAEATTAQEGEQQLSRKKRKMLKRLQVAQLKAQVKRPDVVEVTKSE